MYFYIVNPASGNGRINKIQTSIKSLLYANKISGEFVKTTGKGDAARIVKIALRDGAKTIVAVGGDSTVSEIINTIKDSKTALGIIPIGRTNFLADSLGIYDWKSSIPILAKRKTKTLSLGKINENFFISTVEIGIEGEMAKHRDEDTPLKKLFFKKRIAESVFSYKPFDIQIKFDNEFDIESKIINLSIVNTKMNKKTGKLYANKDKLTAFVLPEQSKWQTLRNVSELADSSFERIPEISQFKASTIFIDTPLKPQNVYADSAFIGQTPVLVKTSSKKVKVIVNKDR